MDFRPVMQSSRRGERKEPLQLSWRDGLERYDECGRRMEGKGVLVFVACDGEGV